jgi:hypothetical protein
MVVFEFVVVVVLGFVFVVVLVFVVLRFVDVVVLGFVFIVVVLRFAVVVVLGCVAVVILGFVAVVILGFVAVVVFFAKQNFPSQPPNVAKCSIGFSSEASSLFDGRKSSEHELIQYLGIIIFLLTKILIIDSPDC